MKRVFCTAVILIATSPLSYGKCKLEAGAVPDVPDAAVVGLHEMLEARANVTQYMQSAGDFVRCAQGRGDRRTSRVMKKMHRLSKNFNRANVIFSERVTQNPALLNQPEQMIAQQ